MSAPRARCGVVLALALAAVPASAQAPDTLPRVEVRPLPPDSTAEPDTAQAAEAAPPMQKVGQRLALRDTALRPPLAAPADLYARYRADPDFRYDERARGLTPWQRFTRWLGRWLDALFGGASLSRSSARLLGGALLLGLVALLAGLFARHGGGAFFGRTGAPDPEARDALPDSLDDVDLEAWLRAAVAAGDGRRAVRAHYLRALQRLHAAGRLVYRPRATNADYLAALDPGLAAAFAPLARRFEELWYGDYPLRADELARADEAGRRLADVLDGRRAGPVEAAADA